MSSLSKRERIAALMVGKVADRPPVSVWHHFLQEETDKEAFVKATVAFQQEYDWDLVKLNPRAVCFTEAWGNRYDYGSYIGYGPKCVEHILDTAKDLEKITVKKIDQGPLGEQVEIVRKLRKVLGEEVPIVQTIYSPLAVILNLTGTRMVGRYRPAPREESPVVRFIHEEPVLLQRALSAMTQTIAAYVEALMLAGADGLFYTPLGLAREGYLTAEERETYLKPYDLEILDAAKGGLKILHTCGIYAHPEFFADYPIHVLHWSENAPGNPSLKSAPMWMKGKAVMGGVDERIFGQGASSREKIREAARQAVKSHRYQSFFLAPECSVAPTTSKEEYLAIREAVE